MNEDRSATKFTLRTFLVGMAVVALASAYGAALGGVGDIALLLLCVGLAGLAFAVPGRIDGERWLEWLQQLAWPMFFVLLALIFSAVILLPLFQNSPRVPGARTICVGNCLQIALALLRMEAATPQGFPPACSRDDSGQPLHSWRTAILPYLDRPELHAAINFGVAWDAPENEFLSQVTLEVFLCQSTTMLARKHPRTGAPQRFFAVNYVVITGEGFLFEEANRTRLDDILDEPAETILFAELADSGFPWCEPRDLSWEELQRRARAEGNLQFLSKHPGCFVATMANGNQRTLPSTISLDQLHALLTIAGGEKVDWPAIDPR